MRHASDWEAWLSFFLEGVRVTAEGAVSTEGRLTELFTRHRGALDGAGRRAGSARRVHETFRRRPVLTIGDAAELTGLSFPTASSAIEVMVEAGIVEELTGRRRGRVYAYGAYLDVLNEGMEPL